MSKFANHIPVKQSWVDEPIDSEISYEVWNIAHRLIFDSRHLSVSAEILAIYALGYYDAQVKNGGHSQLTNNMDIGELRSPFLFDSFRFGAEMIGAKEFSQICADFQTWVLAHPVESKDQTGFEGGRAEFLDDLDARFFDMDLAYKSTLRGFLEKSAIEKEREFLRDCVDRGGDWTGDLDALATVWLLGSDSIVPVRDEDFSTVLNAMLAK